MTARCEENLANPGFGLVVQLKGLDTVVNSGETSLQAEQWG